MPLKYIWIKNKQYHYYKKYNTWEQAKKIAKELQTKYKKLKYFIVEKEDTGYIMTITKYNLYLSEKQPIIDMLINKINNKTGWQI